MLKSRGMNSSIERNSIRLYRYKMKTLVKEQVKRLLEQLPDDATWEDLQYAILIHQTVEAVQKLLWEDVFKPPKKYENALSCHLEHE